MASLSMEGKEEEENDVVVLCEEVWAARNWVIVDWTIGLLLWWFLLQIIILCLPQ